MYSALPPWSASDFLWFTIQSVRSVSGSPVPSYVRFYYLLSLLMTRYFLLKFVFSIAQLRELFPSMLSAQFWENPFLAACSISKPLKPCLSLQNLAILDDPSVCHQGVSGCLHLTSVIFSNVTLNALFLAAGFNSSYSPTLEKSK